MTYHDMLPANGFRTERNTKFQKGDRFTLKNDKSRQGTILRPARDNEFGCDLYFDFDYYVVIMDDGGNAPIQTSEGGIAENSDMLAIPRV